MEDNQNEERSLTDEFLDDLSTLISGLQVPISMGILGAAHDPAVKMLHLRSGFGWTNAEEIRPALEAHLAKIVAEHPVTVEIDRNARAYGWEVANGHPLTDKIEETSPENPFMSPDWRDGIQIDVTSGS